MVPGHPKIVKVSGSHRRNPVPATLNRNCHRPIAGDREPVGGPKTGRSKLRTAAVWALAIFIAINAALISRSSKEKWSIDRVTGTGSIELALTDFYALKQRPSVVLLGSSLMMFPFWSLDREIDPHLPDIFHHHASRYMEGQLTEHGWQEPRVFSFAICGQMLSDAYIYLSELLREDKKPDWIVYGIAPRDFSDRDLSAPTATMTFKRLVGLENLGKYAYLYLPGWQDKADFVAAHACFFYGKRWRLQQEVQKAVNKAYGLLGFNPSSPAAAGETHRGFTLDGSPEFRWQSSTNEYRRRYRNIEGKDLDVQMGFLEKLLVLCQERGIRVMLINMPLTETNRSLLPAGFYSGFRSRIARLADRPGVTFLDLGESPDFVRADYWDTAHLNHSGARKLLPHIVRTLAEAGTSSSR